MIRCALNSFEKGERLLEVIFVDIKLCLLLLSSELKIRFEGSRGRRDTFDQLIHSGHVTLFAKAFEGEFKCALDSEEECRFAVQVRVRVTVTVAVTVTVTLTVTLTLTLTLTLTPTLTLQLQLPLQLQLQLQLQL